MADRLRKQRYKKPRVYTPLPFLAKALLIMVIVVGSAMVIGYGYWANNVANTLVTVPRVPLSPGAGGTCPATYTLVAGVCQPDPFELIWNGQASTSASSRYPGLIRVGDAEYGSCAANTACSLAVPTPTQGATVIVMVLSSACDQSHLTVTDSLSNSYSSLAVTTQGCGSLPAPIVINLWTGVLASSSADTVTVKDTVNSIENWDLMEVRGATGVARVAFGGANNGGSSGHSSLTTPMVSPQMALDYFAAIMGGANPTTGFSTNATVITNFDANNYVDPNGSDGTTTSWLLQAGSAAVYNFTDTYSGAFAISFLHVVFVVSGTGGCSGSQTVDFFGYLCQNSAFTNGFLDQYPNSTTPAVALSKGAVDLSQCVGKPCAFANAFCSGSGCAGTGGSAFPQGQVWAFALTSNSTLPVQRGYDPINDPSVALLVYCVKESGSNANCYVLMQRQPGQPLLTSSGNDPGPATCNYALTYFRCMTVALNTGGGSNGDNLVANYTGGNTGTQGSSLSYWCGGSVAIGLNTCNVGGKGFIADQNGGTISYPGTQFNQTLFPWFNVQNNYHALYWEAASGASLAWENAANSLGGIISYYLPPTNTVSATVDSGGFFGWVGRGLGGAWNTLTGVGSQILNSVGGPLLNFGNSLLSTFVTAISTSFTVMAVGFQIMLNDIGSIWGDPNFGTHIFQTLQGIVNIIIQIFNGIGTFALWIFNILFVVIPFFIGNFVTLIVSVSVSVYVIVLALIPFVIAFGGIINLPLQTLFFFDYVFGLAEVFFAGLSGFMAWIRFNIWLFTLGWKVFDYALSKLLWFVRSIKQLIPVVG